MRKIDSCLIRRASHIIVIALVYVGCCLGLAHGDDSLPEWWPQALKEAREEGYDLITPPLLQSLYTSKTDFVILDVRPFYEYRAAHLPKAVNLEFHLGDRATLEPDKEKSFQRLLGPEKTRLIIIYCRNYK